MKKQPVKAVFFDVDGTLISHRSGEMPASAVKTLWALHRKGILLFVCTGRHRSEMPGQKGVLDLPWDGFITLNGQYCYDGQAPYHRQPIGQADIARLIARAEEMDVPCKFVEEDRMYVSRHTDVVRQVQAAIHTPLPPVGDLRRGLSHSVYLVVTYCTPEQQRQLLEPLEHVRSTNWNPRAFDVIHSEGSKANGVRMTCRRYGLSPDEVMGFGDGENDADMLKTVGLGVAMGNGAQAAKDAAAYVADDVDRDGLARAAAALGLVTPEEIL